MGRLLYFDCFSGVSGDMILGALLDAGLPLDALRRALGSLAAGEYEIDAERVSRAGVAATKFRLREHGGATGGPHGDEHRHDDRHSGSDDSHAHHNLQDIFGLINRSALSSAGKTRARHLFQRLGEAEAAIHQVPIERVHLHEVGALDSIVDIVGAVFGIEWFGAERIVASPLNVGSGTVRCGHGILPVPAPATASLLTGVPVYSTGVSAELVTPTGALIISDYAASYDSLPAMTIERIGYGAGESDFGGHPNVLRVFVGRIDGRESAERVVVIECEIDDMSPQIFGPLMDRLHDAGALDVFYTSVQMKKSRPGTLVTIVAPPDRRDALCGILFRETTTIGVRYQDAQRECLEREILNVATPIGGARVKVARRGGTVVNVAPEFEDVARLAGERDLPIKEVLAIVMKAYLDRGPHAGTQGSA